MVSGMIFFGILLVTPVRLEIIIAVATELCLKKSDPCQFIHSLPCVKLGVPFSQPTNTQRVSSNNNFEREKKNPLISRNHPEALSLLSCKHAKILLPIVSFQSTFTSTIKERNFFVRKQGRQTKRFTFHTLMMMVKW